MFVLGNGYVMYTNDGGRSFVQVIADMHYFNSNDGYVPTGEPPLQNNGWRKQFHAAPRAGQYHDYRGSFYGHDAWPGKLRLRYAAAASIHFAIARGSISSVFLYTPGSISDVFLRPVKVLLPRSATA